MDMTRDNVLLYEKHDVVTSEVVALDQNRTAMIHGPKVFRVIKPVEDGFEELTAYDSNKDHTDLSCLKNYIGNYLVSVDINSYNKIDFEWNCSKIQDASEDSEIVMITEGRKCTDEEVQFLNELFPEYYNNCFFIKDGKKITPLTNKEKDSDENNENKEVDE